MATVKRAHYNADVYDANTLKGFIDSFNCSLLSTSVSSNILTVNVNNVLNVIFDFPNARTKVVYNGTTSEYSRLWRYNPATVTAACSDTLFYIHFNNDYSAGRRFVFVYELIDNKSYFGAIGSGVDYDQYHAWFSIADITIKSVETNEPYNHGARLNYSCATGFIHYSSPDCLFGGGYRSNIEDPNFITTTAVAQDQVITFQGKNYYSVGANTLVRVD